jgi:hypothetical protein
MKKRGAHSNNTARGVESMSIPSELDLFNQGVAIEL